MLKKYQEWLTQLFYYFKNSALREKQLHKIQEILEHPTLKYREIHSVRWLSFFEALQAVYRTIDPLLTYLHNRQADKDPKAKGLLKYMASRQFLFVTYLMMNVIPLVSKLCLTLQSETLDVAKAKVAIDLCLTDLEAYKRSTMHFKTHLEDFDSLVQALCQWKMMGLTEPPTDLSSTSLPKQWGKPRGPKVEAVAVPEMVVLKPKPDRKRKPLKNTLVDNRYIYSPIARKLTFKFRIEKYHTNSSPHITKEKNIMYRNIFLLYRNVFYIVLRRLYLHRNVFLSPCTETPLYQKHPAF
ncbi:hypothetical protein FSP39_014493 [Pinctada imbricata]|uniref:Uncharacterized protein n=1 Tax=Pinctada imbricata TaxID=66713 RepID=A0AA88XJ07_PINIB|nr:hypothetical protein FSP39_014493 [Pinctada imbricata]